MLIIRKPSFNRKNLFLCVYLIVYYFFASLDVRFCNLTMKLVIAHLPRTIEPIFSLFLTFYCYFTRLKARGFCCKI